MTTATETRVIKAIGGYVFEVYKNNMHWYNVRISCNQQDFTLQNAEVVARMFDHGEPVLWPGVAAVLKQSEQLALEAEAANISGVEIRYGQKGQEGTVTRGDKCSSGLGI